MADKKHLLRIAAVVGDVVVNPGHGAGHVLDDHGMLHCRSQPVIDADEDESPPAKERRETTRL